MKLSDLLEDVNKHALEDWMKKYKISGGTSVRSQDFQFLNTIGAFDFHNKEITLGSDRTNQTFDPPMDASWWGKGLRTFNFDHNAAYYANSNIIDGFEKVPTAIEIRFLHTTITSFKGIEKLSTLNALVFAKSSDIKCGVLRLLKCQSLDHLEMAPIIKLDNPKLHKVLTIVRSHLGESNALDCQNELIEADLDEYATL